MQLGILGWEDQVASLEMVCPLHEPLDACNREDSVDTLNIGSNAPSPENCKRVMIIIIMAASTIVDLQERCTGYGSAP